MSKLCLGLMSGTSMDGIDAAIIETDGEMELKSLASGFYPYEPEFQKNLKYAELLLKKFNGNIEQASENFAPTFSATKIHSFADLIHLSTVLHAEAVQHLIQDHGFQMSDIELVGYHGQTLFHAPHKKISVQVGDPALLAQLLQLPVVSDFRSDDIRHGGQGAPLAPVYHWALAKDEGLIPVAILNCGGIANVSFVLDENPENLIACDTGPGNVLLDRFVREKTQQQFFYDHDGQWALAGKTNATAFEALMDQALPEGFLAAPPPKSLDSHDCRLPEVFQTLSLQDGCATLAAFTAECIVETAKVCSSLPMRWILAGGGWHNPAILLAFKQKLEFYLKHSPQILTAKQVGWQQDALEAEAFAYLGMRVMKKLPISFPGTTGVKTSLTGGKIFFPNGKVSS